MGPSRAAAPIRRRPSREAAERLLVACELPTSDLEDRHFEGFFACGPEEEPSGIVGIEIHGRAALLRSLAVAASARGAGLGRALVEEGERYAWERGVEAIYLLTMTAERFFAGLGYRKASRDAAPEEIQQTKQFSSLCPSTTALMVKMREGHAGPP